MKIKVVAPFYREELLVPHFLKHYAFADTIIALVGKAPDRTEELLRADPRVVYIPLEMPEGVDDILRMQVIDAVINSPDPIHDWQIIVDSDEFIWPHDAPLFPDVLAFPGTAKRYTHQLLSAVPADENVLMANMWQVFRNATDVDLTYDAPAVLQRRHGIPEREGGGKEGYRKPIVIRTNAGIHLGAGNHKIDAGPAKVSKEFSFDGAHWAMADPSLVQRRIRDRRDRMSPTNFAGRLGSHLFTATTTGLLDEMEAQINAPRVF